MKQASPEALLFRFLALGGTENGNSALVTIRRLVKVNHVFLLAVVGNVMRVNEPPAVVALVARTTAVLVFH